MTHPLSAEEMKFDISTDPRINEGVSATESPFWSTCMGREVSDFPVYVAGFSPFA